MASADLAALAAVVLTAVAVLPGTLGILMLTNRIAATPAGARYIYSQSGLLIVVAIGLIIYAIFASAAAGGMSAIVIGAGVGLALLLFYGFLMHAKMLFRPVRKPTFIPARDAIERYGPEEEVVGVIDGSGKPYAFIARLARRPHIVYQEDGDAPFIMTHCILAHSSMSYALAGNFRQPDITITAALANNMVFYEKNSRCSVVQLNNRLEGRNEPLHTVPTLMTSLKTWARLYPESPVWVRAIEWRDMFYLKLLARADVIDPSSPVMVYPLKHSLDERLPMKSMVLGVAADSDARTYTIDLVRRKKVVNDRLANLELAIFCDDDHIQIFDRRIDPDTVLSFACSVNGEQFVDERTGSTWDATGKCVAGKFAEQQLTPIPHYNKIFWFVWSDYHPGVDIYGVQESERLAASAA